ncbi:unnamed protein product [Protopolystoma xenopodis]|uniref:Uncharacterized protein n=1 Tax=Protopolystoma xenopodis TaxID=117903 RepID=A0A448WWU5_9PLAT|nr:unnamed protein product [Protopolystoma xenopodis]
MDGRPIALPRPSESSSSSDPSVVGPGGGALVVGHLASWLQGRRCPSLPLTPDQVARLSWTQLVHSVRPLPVCGRCHIECEETCSGTGAHQCIGACRHLRVSLPPEDQTHLHRLSGIMSLQATLSGPNLRQVHWD